LSAGTWPVHANFANGSGVALGSECLLLTLLVKVTWTPSSSPNVERYKVFRATSVDGEYKKVGTVLGGPAGSFIDTTAALGTTYYYVVQSYWEEWSSVPTSAVGVTTVSLC